IINGTLSSVGDCCAQTMFVSLSCLPAQTLRFLIFGSGIGPLAGMWNRYLEHNFPIREVVVRDAVALDYVKIDSTPKMTQTEIPITDVKHRRTASGRLIEPLVLVEPAAVPLPNISPYLLAKRLAMDQIFMAPISFIVFLLAMGIMEGLWPKQIWDKITLNLIPILLTNWKIWPLIQVVTFLYIPLKFRVPTAGIFGVMWTIYLSWQTANSAAKASAA
ncbi:hypothetical protein T439DRAFT_290643, partial [Meredithblackwellia eburnea MCA 4105]